MPFFLCTLVAEEASAVNRPTQEKPSTRMGFSCAGNVSYWRGLR
jgi:hypothetical protein